MTSGILEFVRGRKPMPDGRRNTYSTKLSDAEAASVDAAVKASGLLAAAWVRQALVSAAAGPGAAEPVPEAPRKSRAKGPCGHRVPPGSYCRSCGRLI